MPNYTKVLAGTQVGKIYNEFHPDMVEIEIIRPEIDQNFYELVLVGDVFINNKIIRTYESTPIEFNKCVTRILTRSNDLRESTLNKFQKKSVGISVIYSSNIDIARRYISGDVSPVITGETPVEYLTNMGSLIGLSATQFANYIISESTRLGDSAATVEKKYLSVKAAATTGNVEILSTAWYDFYDFCKTVITE
jgi:hypothetical protein